MNIGRAAGVFYLGTFATGVIALAFGAGMAAANAIATLCYVGVTILFYFLFRPVSRPLSLAAALFSATGCALSFIRFLSLAPVPISELAFFGCYCILIGYLIATSRLLPRAIGVLLMVGGVSWLTFGWAPLGRMLSPYSYAPGILAEGLLTIWLLVYGSVTIRDACLKCPRARHDRPVSR